MVFVTRKVHFNAAHRLHNPDRSEEWNRRTYGECNHPNWHGHNYQLEVVVSGEPDPETGFLIDLKRLHQIVEQYILEPCDHRNLNLDVPFLDGVNPTTENLVIAFYRQLETPVKQEVGERGELYLVRLYETERNMAEYTPFRS
ncbi:MAG: 6-carboxytetrahydropterin synthase [Balneolaceae bacterium]